VTGCEGCGAPWSPSGSFCGGTFSSTELHLTRCPTAGGEGEISRASTFPSKGPKGCGRDAVDSDSDDETANSKKKRGRPVGGGKVAI